MKTQRIVVRLTPAERARLDRKRGPLTYSAWVRAQINAPEENDAFPPVLESHICENSAAHLGHKWRLTFSDGYEGTAWCPGRTV